MSGAAGGPADVWQPREAARVLLVLDQIVLASTIKFALAHVRGEFVVRVAEDDKAALELLAQWRPDLVVVDVDLAEGNILASLGFATPPQGREADASSDPARGQAGGASRSARVAVVALTRRGDIQAKLSAFEQGVDDLLAVPFSPEELVARILAVLRRTAPHTGASLQPLLRLGALEIDLLNRSVRIGLEALHLTALEQSLLYLLVANAGRVLTRDEILDHLWGVDFIAESNVIDRHIRNLRIKLQDDWRHPRYIFTVPGQGYRFMPTVIEPTGEPSGEGETGTQPPTRAVPETRSEARSEAPPREGWRS